jgi:vacuolar-type H+-ATPase subunit I/STV1
MSFFGVSREDLTPLLPNEYSSKAGISAKAGELSMALVRIKAVLEDAEKKQSTDPSVKEQLLLLKDAEYVVEDILAEVSINSNRLQDTSTFDPKNNIFHHNMVERLNKIGSRFNELEERRNKLLLQEDVIAEDKSVEVAGQTSLIQRRHR